MPVDRRAFIRNLVGDLDLNIVAPVRLNQWSWELAVDQQASVFVAIGRAWLLRDGPFVVSGHACVRCVFVHVGVLYHGVIVSI